MGRSKLYQVKQMPGSLLYESELPIPGLGSVAMLPASMAGAAPLGAFEAELRIAPVTGVIAVPEPGTLSLVVLGLVVLAVGATVGRRRRRREGGRWPRRKYGRIG